MQKILVVEDDIDIQDILKNHLIDALFDYLLFFRIELSLALLVDQQLSITVISNLCGFSSSSYYSKVFREHMGCTPTAYQAGHFV